MVKEVKGDLIELALKGEFDYIVHGCNCMCSMGAGIAAQIAAKFPEAVEADKGHWYKGDPNRLGNYTTALIKRDRKVFTIINLYTQYVPGPDFKIYALQIGLFKLAKSIPKEARIGFPRIGAGIGGGDWDRILEVIRVQMAAHHCTVVEWEKKIETP